MTAQEMDHEALEIVSRGCTDAVIVVDQQTQICIFNPAAEAIFNVSADEVRGQSLDDQPVLHSLLPLFQQAASGSKSVRQQLDLSTGSHWVQVVVIETHDSPTHHMPTLMRELVHELKTPVATAISQIDVIKAFGLNARQADFADRARYNLMTAATMINELLDMAWLESGSELQIDSVDLNRLIEQTTDQFRDFARQQGVEFELDLPPEAVVIQGDERGLHSAIGNLLSNAIKYSPDGGSVRISAQTAGNTLTIEVQDGGLGIAPEHMPNLFDAFYRVRTPETTHIKGSGLGLPIVKAVIEKHGGQVFVESKPGQGSVFGFTLPVS